MPNYEELRQILRQRLEVIADSHLRENDPDEQLQQLQDASEKISAWHSENRGQIPAQLNHFLKQSSLSKALDYIQAL